MTENRYWRNTKLDFLSSAEEQIDNHEALRELVKKMTKIQIDATYKAFEDPYSAFNLERDYDPKYWTNWKAAVREEHPDLILFGGPL